MAIIIKEKWQEDVIKYISEVDLIDKIHEGSFDVILVDGFWLWLLPFARRFHLPYLVITTRQPSPYIFDLFKTSNMLFQIAYDNYTMNHDQAKVMSFLSRSLNTLQYISCKSFYAFVFFGMHQVQVDYNIAPHRWPSHLFSEGDVWLSGMDKGWDFPHPTFPNVEGIGGVSARDVNQLDQEFLSIMESERSSEVGVVVVSLGSVVSSMPQDEVDAMSNALARLPHTVIWKEIPPRPSFVGNNTHFKKWIPQQDLLGHPNTRAFVSHCGNNGAFESLYHGIPIIGIPFFGDQKDVAYRAMSSGMGIVVERKELAKDDVFYDAVWEVLNNPQYKARAEFLSAVHRDMPDTPAERAAFWVEYVYRHKGARFIRSKAASMDFIQDYQLDVFFFLFFAVLFVFYVLYKSMKCLVQIIRNFKLR